MTSRTRLIVLSSVFVVLLATYLVGALGMSRAGRSPVAGEPVLGEDIVSESALVRIRGEGQSEESTTTELRREQESSWLVDIGGDLYPADPDHVGGLLDALTGLRKVRVAASGEEYFADFKVDEDAARLIALEGEDGQELSRLFVGKAVTGGGQMYLRRAGEDDVYIVDRDIGFYFGQQKPYWSDLVPFPQDLSPQAITRLSVEADLQVDSEMRVVDTFTVFREPGDGGSPWRIDSGAGDAAQELAQQDVDTWASRIPEYEPSAFVTEAPAETGLGNPAARLVIEDEAGRRFEVRIGDSAGDARFYTRVSGPGVDVADDGRPFLYTVSSWQVRRILRNRDAIVAGGAETEQ